MVLKNIVSLQLRMNPSSQPCTNLQVTGYRLLVYNLQTKIAPPNICRFRILQLHTFMICRDVWSQANTQGGMQKLSLDKTVQIVEKHKGGGRCGDVNCVKLNNTLYPV